MANALCRAMRLSVSMLSALICVIPAAALASQAGITGVSGNPDVNNGIFCGSCHVGGGTATVQLLAGNGGAAPTTVTGGTSVALQIRVAGGGTRAGFNVSTSAPFTLFRAGGADVTPPSGTELTHAGPKNLNGGAATFNFTMDTSHVGGTITVYGAGLAANGAGTGGDNAGRFTQTINVTPAPGAPLVLSAAKVGSGTMTAFNVEVLGIDNSPEAQLLYTWSATGPGTVTFTPNGTNAAKKSGASFSAPGEYKLTATIRDPDGSQVTSSVDVNVGAYAARIAITPDEVRLPLGGMQQFTASAIDQFGKPLAQQPVFQWGVTGGGRIDADTGLFKGQTSPGGPFTVFVSGGGAVSSAAVYITSSSGTGPSIANALRASPNLMTARLSILGADDGGEAALSYTWSKFSGPGDVSFSANGNNGAKTSTATFSQLGLYRISVTIKDASNLTTSASVDVNIDGQPGELGGQGPTVTLTPPGSSKVVSGKITLTAQATDATEVVFELDGKPVGSATGNPWQMSLDTRKYSDGKHSLVAVGKGAGGEGRSATVELEFANSSGGGCSSVPGVGVTALLALAGMFRRRRMRAQ